MRLSNYLSKLNCVPFILLFTLIGLLVMIAFNGVLDFFEINDVEIALQQPVLDLTLSNYTAALVVVPLIETLLFQKAIYWVGIKIPSFRYNKLLLIIISAILFASAHFYSIAYIIYTFIIGAILMYCYIVKVGRYPFWTTFAIHGLFNTIVSIVELFGFYGDAS